MHWVLDPLPLPLHPHLSRPCPPPWGLVAGDKTIPSPTHPCSPPHRPVRCSGSDVRCVFHPKPAEVTRVFCSKQTSLDHRTTTPPQKNKLTTNQKTNKQKNPDNTIHAFWLKRAVDIIFRFLFWLVSHLQYPPEFPISPRKKMCINAFKFPYSPRERRDWKTQLQGPKEQETRRWLPVMLIMILLSPL